MSQLLSLRRQFNRTARTYQQAAKLPEEIARRLLSRLTLFHLQPLTVMDVGAGVGLFSKTLAQTFPQAQVIAVDIAEQRLAKLAEVPRVEAVQFDTQCLPIKDASADLVCSNLWLPWCQHYPNLFAEVNRVLKPQGLWLFSTLGPNTLQELRSHWASIDTYRHVNDFLDMHDLGDQLLAAGLLDPVVETEQLTIHYSSLRQLLNELKALGSVVVGAGRDKGLMGKQRFTQLLTHYPSLVNCDKIATTCEVIYGHAWKAQDQTYHQDSNTGDVRIPITSIRKRG